MFGLLSLLQLYATAMCGAGLLQHLQSVQHSSNNQTMQPRLTSQPNLSTD
jgi:hypothetical protein